MISLALSLIFFFIYIIPVNQIRSAYVGLSLIAILGGIEILGLLGQVSVSSNPADNYAMIGVLIVTLFASFKKEIKKKSLFLDPIGILVYMALLEFGFVSSLMAFKLSLIISLLFSSQEMKKNFYKIVIVLMSLLSLNLYINQLLGPIEPRLLEGSLSNLILYKYYSVFLNIFFVIALLIAGIKSSIHHKDPFAIALFLLVNLYFSQMEIYTLSYYITFGGILLYALKNQSINLFGTLQVLLSLLFFQFASEQLILFSSLFLILELAKMNQVHLLGKLEAININFLILGLYLILYSFSSSWHTRVSMLLIFLLAAVYIENKEKWVLK